MAADEQLFARFGKTEKAGTVLFKEGDEGARMFVIQSGKVSITKTVRDEDKTLAILGPGEFLGEMAILNDKPRTATATVVEEAKLLVLDGRTFEQMVVSNTEIAVRLIKKMARRLDAANNLIEVLMHRDPKARVILGLSREAAIVGTPLEDGSVMVPSTESELAEQFGVDEKSLIDVFRRLDRLGIIDSRSDGVLVRDNERLHEFLEFLEMQHKFGDP